jgi:hypothetical protein
VFPTGPVADFRGMSVSPGNVGDVYRHLPLCRQKCLLILFETNIPFGTVEIGSDAFSGGPPRRHLPRTVITNHSSISANMILTEHSSTWALFRGNASRQSVPLAFFLSEVIIGELNLTFLETASAKLPPWRNWLARLTVKLPRNAIRRLVVQAHPEESVFGLLSLGPPRFCSDFT